MSAGARRIIDAQTRARAGAGWRQRQRKIANLRGGAGHFASRRTANGGDDPRRRPAGLPGELRGSKIATIMQNPRSAFNPLHTMATHARETCRALGKPADDATLTAVLAAVGLEEAQRVLKLYPFEMSGGMLQRMMIAMALLCEAPFIIADEPTTDLDAVAQARILDLLAGVMQNRGPGMLLVTHDMGVVARLADDVAVMDSGCIVEQGDVDSLFRAPQHSVTRGLVAAHLALYGLELA